MAFQVSAGVEVKEVDLTNVVPAVSTSIGGYAGQFRWGPINQIKLISSEDELAGEFGKPNDYYAKSFFTAASFLKYGNALKVVRTKTDGALNASSSSPGGRLLSLNVKTFTGEADNSPLGNINAASDLGEFTIASSVGNGAVIRPQYEVSSAAANTSHLGSGYETDDSGEVTVSVGENQTLVLEVTAGGDGVPDSLAVKSGKNVTLNSPSFFSAVATSSTADAGAGSDGSSGSGLKVDLVYQLKSFAIDNGGTGYATTDGVTAGGGTAIDIGDSPKFKVLFKGEEIYPASTNQSNSPVGYAIAPSLSSPGSNTATLIENEDKFDEIQSSLGATSIFSRYAGTLGSETKVYVVTSTNFATLTLDGVTTKVGASFDGAPGANEIHVLVTSSADALTGNGTTETEVEKWAFLGTTAGAKNTDGSNNFYVDVINAGSDWIYIPAAISSIAGLYDLNNGKDATDDANISRTDGEITTGLDLFADSETVDVNLLFTETDTNGNNVIGNKVLSVATARKDVVGFVAPPTEDTVNTTTPLDNVQDYKNSLTPIDSYGVIGSTAAYVYDKYNDKFLYIGTQGHLAGLCANTDQVAETWFSPGGFNRGQLRGVTKLAYNPKKADRDELYKNGINPIVTFPGQGTVLFGDKTLQAKPSAFDRINVRRLFITLEKAIATAAKFQLFELNDEFTRAAFRNLVEPFLRDVQGRRGITDFFVVCDETNNTGQVIDSNRFVADIFIKPARSINFITLNFVATRTGVDFSEVVGAV